MVMEAATLSGPQRKCNVVPVQKSLSLPSYARVGGEGIDHRLIFAALEQKEKIRRKSKIFTREKTARQNIFCLPISTGSKCRETSLSSDTSCSSLEYQKPKTATKPKKEDTQPKTKPNDNDQTFNEQKAVKTSTVESKTNLECVRKNASAQNVVNGHSEQNHSLFKGNRSPVDIFRLNVGSSDSMERSSRSSNDSLTRKERLVAIKARVEAEREKYGHSSSEEEACSNMTRYNSDGVIHRTVREVKSRSYRHEKRLRRRSQGEWATKKTERRNNLSLCLNPEDDGIKLHLEKLDRLNSEINNLEVKTDYCPSPSFPELSKKSYFSDFPSRENVTKFVQQRIRHIEEEERKRRSGSDFFDKLKSSPRMSPLSQDKPVYASTEHVNKCEKKSDINHYISDIRYNSNDFSRHASPIPKTTQAPTPPPRSPKSITFVNKAFLQHQNSTLIHPDSTIEKKNLGQPNVAPIVPTRHLDKSTTKLEVITRDKSYFHGDPDDKQQMRELFNFRRKTCGNFDFVDEKILNDLCSSIGTTGSSNLTANNSNQLSSSLTQIKSRDNKILVTEGSSYSVRTNGNKSNINKWEESERRREFMFNSLENKKKCNMLPWIKKKNSPINTDVCVCFLTGENKLSCECKDREKIYKNKNIENDDHVSNFERLTEQKILPEQGRERASKTTDKCFCCLTIGNSEICKCKTNETKLKSENFNIKSVEMRNSPKNVLNGEHKFSEERADTTSQRFTAFKNTTSENFNCLNDKISYNLKSKSNSSATANLDSAMAELESVYLSLKFSSDNLSDRNSLSNISLSEDECKIVNKINKNPSVSEKVNSKRNSIHEMNSYFDALNTSNTNKNSNVLKTFVDHSKPLSTVNILDVPSLTRDTVKDLSINDLFKDLTPQLNSLDRKIDSCINRNSKPNSTYQNDRLDNQQNISPSPISFKKEFYENLQKQQQQSILQRKKHKAVRSLSENISQLMNSSSNGTNKVSPKHSSENNSQIITNSSMSISNSSSESYKPAAIDSWKLEPKKEVSSRFVNRTNNHDRQQNFMQEEIRHIRVSMDSAASQPTPTSVSSPEMRQIVRLSSAVHSPQMSPKCEISKPFQFNSSSNSKETIDKTIDGLEELLNSLLVDVPENNKTSLSKNKDAVPASPPSPSSTGEMRVLQHLDVIRLKPVPS